MRIRVELDIVEGRPACGGDARLLGGLLRFAALFYRRDGELYLEYNGKERRLPKKRKKPKSRFTPHFWPALGKRVLRSHCDGFALLATPGGPDAALVAQAWGLYWLLAGAAIAWLKRHDTRVRCLAQALPLWDGARGGLHLSCILRVGLAQITFAALDAAILAWKGGKQKWRTQ